MDTNQNDEQQSASPTKVEYTSDREIVITRLFDAPRQLVFDAWSKAELFQQWWVPKSLGMALYKCEMDVRTGGTYRLNFGEGMEFFGRYIEVLVPSRIVWTNEESGDNGSVTTVTLEEQGSQTLLVLSELFPTKEAFDEQHGAEDVVPETFSQLDELLTSLK